MVFTELCSAERWILSRPASGESLALLLSLGVGQVGSAGPAQAAGSAPCLFLMRDTEKGKTAAAFVFLPAAWLVESG